ncbi:hypothetical protein LAD77_01635 [Klebsiella pneumoniae]|nr:hypothetical protein [Klebsiella pneumoniae]
MSNPQGFDMRWGCARGVQINPHLPTRCRPGISGRNPLNSVSANCLVVAPELTVIWFCPEGKLIQVTELVSDLGGPKPDAVVQSGEDRDNPACGYRFF